MYHPVLHGILNVWKWKRLLGHTVTGLRCSVALVSRFARFITILLDQKITPLIPTLLTFLGKNHKITTVVSKIKTKIILVNFNLNVSKSPQNQQILKRPLWRKWWPPGKPVWSPCSYLILPHVLVHGSLDNSTLHCQDKFFQCNCVSNNNSNTPPPRS